MSLTSELIYPEKFRNMLMISPKAAKDTWKSSEECNMLAIEEYFQTLTFWISVENISVQWESEQTSEVPPQDINLQKTTQTQGNNLEALIT